MTHAERMKKNENGFESLLLTIEFLSEMDPITFVKQIDVSTKHSLSCYGSRKVIYTSLRV